MAAPAHRVVATARGELLAVARAGEADEVRDVAARGELAQLRLAVPRARRVPLVQPRAPCLPLEGAEHARAIAEVHPVDDARLEALDVEREVVDAMQVVLARERA